MKYIFFAGESVKKQTTDSISENLTDSDLESTLFWLFCSAPNLWNSTGFSLEESVSFKHKIYSAPSVF